MSQNKQKKSDPSVANDRMKPAHILRIMIQGYETNGFSFSKSTGSFNMLYNVNVLLYDVWKVFI